MAARELHVAGKGCVVAEGQGEDEGVDRGGGGGGADGREEGCGGGCGVGYVGRDGVGEEGWVLGHEGDEGAEGRDVQV